MRRRWRALLAGAALLLGLGACADQGGTTDGRPRSELPRLGLDAYSQISFPPGTRFSFSLTTVEAPVPGRLQNVTADIHGDGLEFLGSRVTTGIKPGFDGVPGFPPEVTWLRNTKPADGMRVDPEVDTMNLMVGLEVVNRSYTEVRGIDYEVLGDDGTVHRVHSPVGLGQCYPHDSAACPRRWPKVLPVNPKGG